MTAGAPRSARPVDPASRELAEDLARRSGLSLNEWLARLMADEGPEDATSQDYFTQPARAPTQRYETASHPSDDVGRVAQALERLSDRIESAENRQAMAIAGVERSVREVISRMDVAEREQMQVAARFEGAVQEVQSAQGKLAERVSKVELEAQGPRSAEALKALEGALGKVAGHVYEGERRTREAVTEIGSRVERLDHSERATNGALRDLKSAFGALDERLGSVEDAAGEGIEQVASNLSARVEAVREELAERIAATADARFDRVDQALAQMSEHVRTAEQRSTSALEHMGREVLEVAQSLSRRVATVEHRSAEAADRMGAEVSRIANAVEGRLAHADSIHAQALEKLGGEIARITERLADRIASAERRSAQAIDDVGEQVSRVTERIGQRHERAAGELADRIRQSEERTARLLEDARSKIDARLADTQGRLSEIQARSAPPPVADETDDALFGDAPFPAYEAPAAERAFPRAEPAESYTPVLRQARGEPQFDDEDFEAVAEFDDLLAAEPFGPAAHDTAPEAVVELEAEPDPEPEPNPAPVLEAAPEFVPNLETEAVELEPNVGFDMEDEAPPIAAEAPEPAPHVIESEPEVEALVAHEDEPATLEASEPIAEAEADDDLWDEHEPTVHAEGAEEAVEDAAPESPLTTREVIERARATARFGDRPARAPSAPLRTSHGNVLESLSFGRSRSRSPNLTGALMVASLLAAVSLSAGGFVVLEGQSGGKLPGVSDVLAMVSGDKSAPASADDSQTPVAAMALAPKPANGLAAGPDLSGAYAAAVAKVGAGEAGGLSAVRGLAAQGYAPAQFYLSMLYEDGKAGLKKDPAQARLWTERAAEGGDRAAMHNLALDFFQGVGGPKDASAAADWFHRAADLGLLDSQFNLAGLYEHGEGVPQNAAEAYKWYLIAGKEGDAEAKASALRVRAGLTPDARAIAERSAADFSPAVAAPAVSNPVAAAGGSGSPDVTTAQRALMQLGYYQGPTDGVTSPALQGALAAYQREQSLPVTGQADPATIAKLSAYTR